MKKSKIKVLSFNYIPIIGMMSLALPVFFETTSNEAIASQNTQKDLNYTKSQNFIETKIPENSPPQILSLELDRNEYHPGDYVDVQIKVKNNGTITDATIGFTNITNVGVTSLAEVISPSQFKQIENDIWQANVKLKIPEKIGNTSFNFAAATVDNDKGEGDTVAPGLAPSSFDISDLNFKVTNLKNNDELDREPPVIKDILIDKKIYTPGETVNATIKIQDTSILTEVSLGFVNDPYIGENGIDKFADMSKAFLDENGIWTIPVQLHIPQNSKNAKFKFSHVSAIDEYGNSIGVTSNLAQAESYNKLTFNVTNQNENSKNDDSSSDVTNQNDNSKNDDSSSDVTNQNENSKNDDSSSDVTNQNDNSKSNDSSSDVTNQNDNSKNDNSSSDVTNQNDNSKSNDSSSDVSNQNENSKNDDILPKTGKTLKNMNLLSIAFFITGLLLILRKKYLI